MILLSLGLIPSAPFLCISFSFHTLSLSPVICYLVFMKVHQQITALMLPQKAQVEFVLSYLESLGYFGRGLNPVCSAAVVERYDATEDE